MSTTPLYEDVARQLRCLIAEAGLVPGDRLPTERVLASRLNVSRTSVRQAITLLRTTGLVEPRRGDGVYVSRDVSGLTPAVTVALLTAQHHLPAIMEVRAGVEIFLARLAARRRSSQDIEKLYTACDEMAGAIVHNDDPAPADARFHAEIARIADNPLLEDLMRQLAEPIARTRRASLSRPGRPPLSLAWHRRIAQAIERRDEEGAAQAMREHLLLVADVAHSSTTAS